jgi:hypothetical protein
MSGSHASSVGCCLLSVVECKKDQAAMGKDSEVLGARELREQYGRVLDALDQQLEISGADGRQPEIQPRTWEVSQKLLSMEWLAVRKRNG